MCFFCIRWLLSKHKPWFQKKLVVEIRPSTKFFLTVQVDFPGPLKTSKIMFFSKFQTRCQRDFIDFNFLKTWPRVLPTSWFHFVKLMIVQLLGNTMTIQWSGRCFLIKFRVVFSIRWLLSKHKARFQKSWLLESDPPLKFVSLFSSIFWVHQNIQNRVFLLISDQMPKGLHWFHFCENIIAGPPASWFHCFTD